VARPSVFDGGVSRRPETEPLETSSLGDFIVDSSAVLLPTVVAPTARTLATTALSVFILERRIEEKYQANPALVKPFFEVRAHVHSQNISITEYASAVSVSNSVLSNGINGRPIRSKTFRKLVGHSSLSEDDMVLLGVGWIQDKCKEVGLTASHLNVIPTKGEALIRIVDDPSLVAILRSLGIKEKDNPGLYRTLAALDDSL
jgi:hypothetical protein